MGQLATKSCTLGNPIIYGLLAHSHVWSQKKLMHLNRVDNYLWNINLNIIQHPREMLDLVCVADTASWLAVRLINGKTKGDGDLTYHWEAPDHDPAWEQAKKEPIFQTGTTLAGYKCHSPTHLSDPGYSGLTPIGVMITYLLERLAWEDPSIRSLVNHFYRSGLMVPGQGLVRYWNPAEVYTEQVKKRVLSGLERGLDVKLGGGWNEWATEF